MRTEHAGCATLFYTPYPSLLVDPLLDSAAAVFPARGKLDNNAALTEWCHDLEAAVIKTIESGSMTKDLAICVAGTTKVSADSYEDTETFMNSIAKTFAAVRKGKGVAA